MLPMLAVRAASPPAGPEWSHEVKWDGMRALADLSHGRVRLSTRSGADATDRFPELARLGEQHDDVILDGELCALERGVPSFAALAERIPVKDRATALAMAEALPVTYLIFDLLRLNGTEVTELPWHKRRELLDRLNLHGPRWSVPSVHDDGQALFAATLEQGLEGTVSKRRDSAYQAGRRSPAWVKAPHRPQVSCVVGGWRLERTTRRRIGSLLVGFPGASGLRYVGRVGSGLAERSQVDLMAELRPLARDTSPFAEALPPQDTEGAHWVEPVLVVDVRSLGLAGLAGTGRLRQASYQRLRPDLSIGSLLEDVDPESGWWGL
ncbi:MAG: non-homologous end-joining DNA ligase [Dermatophilaceae bacterium]